MKIKISLDDVQSVYSGRPGCACGCRGKHTYTTGAAKIAAERNGAVNDRVVKQIVEKVEALAAEPGNDYESLASPRFFSLSTDSRLYAIYFKEAK